MPVTVGLMEAAMLEGEPRMLLMHRRLAIELKIAAFGGSDTSHEMGLYHRDLV
jgi:hypothetical protein